jgi:hypothetical protein
MLSNREFKCPKYKDASGAIQDEITRLKIELLMIHNNITE